MRNKRAGSVSSVTEPRLIWVKMVKRNFRGQAKKNHLSLGWKFNSILEEVISHDRYSHILDIQLQQQDFHLSSSLISSGRCEFWKQKMETFKKFNIGETSLHPQTHKASSSSKPVKYYWKSSNRQS